LRWSSQGLRPPVSGRPDRSITPYVICTRFVYRYLFILYVSYSHRIEKHIYCTDLYTLTSALKLRTTPHQYVYAGFDFLLCFRLPLHSSPLHTPAPIADLVPSSSSNTQLSWAVRSRTRTMASSSSSAAPAGGAHQDDIAPLPLIRCPRCNRGVTVWFISGTAKNPGRHFYKCEYHGVCIFIDIDPSASFIRLHKHVFFSSIFYPKQMLLGIRHLYATSGGGRTSTSNTSSHDGDTSSRWLLRTPASTS
jgi:hypothetical protein